MLFSVLLALLPIVLIIVLLLCFNLSSEKAGILSLVLAIILALFYFNTDSTVVIKATLSGIIASLPVALIASSSIFQVSIMGASGALSKIAEEMQRLSPKDKAIQLLIINMAISTMLTGLGASANGLLAPILIAMGYSTTIALLLPSIGYTAFCIYALMGVPLITFAGFVNMPIAEVSKLFAEFMPFLSVCVTLVMLVVAGGFKMLKSAFIPAIILGLSTGFTAIIMAKLELVSITALAVGFVGLLVMLAYLYITKAEVLAPANTSSSSKISLLAALSPWFIITILAILVSLRALPFYNWTFNTMAMPVEIIPNAPEKMRIFWQPWFLMILATLFALPFLKITKQQFFTNTKIAVTRSFKPVVTAMSLFALAYVMNHSGKNADFVLNAETDNMLRLIALYFANVFGKAYLAIAPFLGYIGCFVSGSQTSAIAMFTHLHMITAEKLQTAPLILAIISAIGAGIASVPSPSKLITAAATINKLDEMNKVLPTAFISSIALVILLTIYAAIFYF